MRLALVAVLAALAVAPGASAATVKLQNLGPNEHSTVDLYAFSFRAAPGEANDVALASDPRGILIRDAGAPLTAGSGCQLVPDGAICLLPTPAIGGGLVDLGDGDDRLATALTGNDVLGGPGDDVIEVGSGRLDGGTGADVLHVSNPQAASEVTYATRTVGVSVTEDGVANDGEPGERDDVGSGIESVQGGAGDDVLVAGIEPHDLDGNAGNDRLVGGPRDDDLIGDLGDDVLLGGEGDDRLDGGGGPDQISSGTGDRNVLTGGSGFDQIGSAGAHDVIRTRDGERDHVGCGTSSSSRQRFEVDPFDSVSSCATDLRVRNGQRLHLDRRGRVAIAGHCPADRGTCVGSVRLLRCRRFAVTIGRAYFRVAEGRTRRVRVRITPSARRSVARQRRVCAIATVRSRRTRPPSSAVEVTVGATLLA
jgi:hypothetical protein